MSADAQQFLRDVSNPPEHGREQTEIPELGEGIFSEHEAKVCGDLFRQFADLDAPLYVGEGRAKQALGLQHSLDRTDDTDFHTTEDALEKFLVQTMGNAVANDPGEGRPVTVSIGGVTMSGKIRRESAFGGSLHLELVSVNPRVKVSIFGESERGGTVRMVGREVGIKKYSLGKYGLPDVTMEALDQRELQKQYLVVTAFELWREFKSKNVKVAEFFGKEGDEKVVDLAKYKIRNKIYSRFVSLYQLFKGRKEEINQAFDELERYDLDEDIKFELRGLKDFFNNYLDVSSERVAPLDQSQLAQAQETAEKLINATEGDSPQTEEALNALASLNMLAFESNHSMIRKIYKAWGVLFDSVFTSQNEAQKTRLKQTAEKILQAQNHRINNFLRFLLQKYT